MPKAGYFANTGGGAYVNAGTFTMTGGRIYGNTANVGNTLFNSTGSQITVFGIPISVNGYYDGPLPP